MNSENKTENKILTIPNLLSLFRLILIPVIIWLYWFRKDYFPAGVLLIISGLTDLADGYIARALQCGKQCRENPGSHSRQADTGGHALLSCHPFSAYGGALWISCD